MSSTFKQSELYKSMDPWQKVLLSIMTNLLTAVCLYGVVILINSWQPIIPMSAAFVGGAVGMVWGFYEDWRDS